MKYVAAALVAPFGIIELALRLVFLLPVVVTVIGLFILGEYDDLANALIRPIILPAVAKALSE